MSRFWISLIASSLLFNEYAYSDLLSELDQTNASIVKIKVQRYGEIKENELMPFDTSGSGFVYPSQHHVLTNAHVVRDAKKIIAIDINGTEYPARLIGKDDKTDIALLDVPDLHSQPLIKEENRSLRVGETLYIIGAPYSLDYSLSKGIVSHLNRHLPNYPYLSYIQTDASINPGNSGGPVFHNDGKLIGMVATHFARQGNYTNIGFIIPIDTLDILTELIQKNGSIKRNYIGIQTLYSERISRKYGYSYGILVTSIIDESSNLKKNLLPGDLIIGLDGEKFKDIGDFQSRLFNAEPNSIITLHLLRNGMAMSIMISLTQEIKENGIPKTIEKTFGKEKNFGLELTEGKDGLIIDKCAGESYFIGLREGDIILSINGQTYTKKQIMERISKMEPTELLLVRIKRESNEIILPLGSSTAIKGYVTTD